MSRDVVLQQLDERSAAYRAETERLRAEAERITGLLAVCEAEMERLVTARQVVGELPAVHVAAAVPDRSALPTPRTGSAEVREIGQDTAAPFVEQVLKVLAGHADPVRCRQVAEELGLEITARNVERVRQRLKKAAAAGVVVKTPGGPVHPGACAGCGRRVNRRAWTGPSCVVRVNESRSAQEGTRWQPTPSLPPPMTTTRPHAPSSRR